MLGAADAENASLDGMMDALITTFDGPHEWLERLKEEEEKRKKELASSLMATEEGTNEREEVGVVLARLWEEFGPGLEDVADYAGSDMTWWEHISA